MQLMTDLNSGMTVGLLYGDPGSGKTRFLGSAALCARFAPAFMLSIGGNPVSLRSYASKPTIIPVQSIKDFNEPYDWFYRGQPANHPVAKQLADAGLPTEYKTILVDGGTAVNLTYFNQIVGYKGDATKFETLAPKADPSHYNTQLQTVAFWASQWFGLAHEGNKRPVHVWMSALEREPQRDFRSQQMKDAGALGPDIDAQKYRPAFLGSVLPTMIASYAYVIARMRIVERIPQGLLRRLNDVKTGAAPTVKKDTDYIAIFQPGEDYDAKDQYGALPPYLENPTFQHLAHYLYGDPLP